MSGWRQIWEKERDDEKESSTLAQLLHADGYDTLGAITSEAWSAYTHRIASRLALRPGDSVFDVGCGAGAFLWPLREKGHPVGGLDYSSRQIARAREAMPEVVDFIVGEAASLEEKPRYDSVIACGTFLYFSDLAYAEAALRRMAAKARQSIAILDAPDLTKKDDILRWRKETLGEETYRERYAQLHHLYYAKEWFGQLFAQLGFNYAIEDQILEGYSHSRFRFNAFAWKEGGDSASFNKIR